MKKLGIIGGAGPLASALFYEMLIYESYRVGGSLPEIVLLNYPFSRGMTPEDSQKNGFIVREELRHCVKALEAAGAEVGVLVCNTLHLELAKAPLGKISFLRIPDLVCEEIHAKKSQRLLLLATQNTCDSSLYQQSGLTIFRPSSKGQEVVDKVIDHVLMGKISEEDSAQIGDLIRHFPEAIDGVILGCTDLPVLHHHFPFRADVPIYDSIKNPAKTMMRFL